MRKFSIVPPSLYFYPCLTVVIKKPTGGERIE
jgi:hypothetical protein